MGDVVVAMADGMGRGVFAARIFAAGETLAAFHTIRLPAAEVAALRGFNSTLANYWFEDDADGSALIVLGWLELVNHAVPPNLDRQWQDMPEGAVVTVVASRVIAAGEQLFIDYRFDASERNPDWA
ncbi:MAG: SET domain-containing protein-lysine N-methyltransferase [Hyphomicrobium aestuarii]|nr:SET domain-containing protein-lysine N-methyltransferase [Hyphomicrobium aestuarii]